MMFFKYPFVCCIKEEDGEGKGTRKNRRCEELRGVLIQQVCLVKLMMNMGMWE